MYAPQIAETDPDRPCFVMASTGETVTYGEFEARANRFAHLLRDHGLRRLDHYSIFMENDPRYLEACGAGERAGLYYTCVNSHLTADELAYILTNSESRVLVASRALCDTALDAVAQSPGIELVLVVDKPDGVGDALDVPVLDFVAATEPFPATPIADERLGTPMLYSSGTTGRPKGIVRDLPDVPPSDQLPLFHFLIQLWRYRDGMRYLSPAPLYHSAPQAAVGLTVRMGGTAVIMERFDPETYLELIERHQITHSQLVPTMFSRMLKLPEEARTRHDLSSLEIAVHAAAPCPVQVKEQMIDWWGPIIHEYYGATEAIGFSACDSEEWLAHKGTVGKVIVGTLHVLDEEGQPCVTGEPGTLWFEPPTSLSYFNDDEKTAESTMVDPNVADVPLATTGDVGYVDEDGYLYLTDRRTFMIISGGVNIYPQETEDLLITHPKVADAAVFGVPNVDLGEEVKAVVQPMPDIAHDDALRTELMQFCLDHLSKQKCPRSIDFDPELPRLPTGKLYKRVLRDRYWGDGASRIVST
ncbi:MAG: AMP-binding protein [Actinomycetota bacterium]